MFCTVCFADGGERKAQRLRPQGLPPTCFIETLRDVLRQQTKKELRQLALDWVADCTDLTLAVAIGKALR